MKEFRECVGCKAVIEPTSEADWVCSECAREIAEREATEKSK